MEQDQYFDSADKALSFCCELSMAGVPYLFRGQTRDWPIITPSLFRGGDVDRNIAASILTQFTEWANTVPQMSRYQEDAQQITAIAQHYGIPTPFLDLTTDPNIAAIFAAGSNDDAPEERPSSIVSNRKILKDWPRLLSMS